MRHNLLTEYLVPEALTTDAKHQTVFLNPARNEVVGEEGRVKQTINVEKEGKPWVKDPSFAQACFTWLAQSWGRTTEQSAQNTVPSCLRSIDAVPSAVLCQMFYLILQQT